MTLKDLLARNIIQIRRECPFFGALMLFADILFDDSYSTAATDGRNIFINEKFYKSLDPSQQNGLLLHEVLHMALLHITRRETRDLEIWNIAADIVVNNLVQENTSFKLPKKAIIDRTYRDNSVEQIYEKLLKKTKSKLPKLTMVDILVDGENSKESRGGRNNIQNEEDLETYWQDKIKVLQNQHSEEGGKGIGNLPLGIGKEIQIVLDPEVDWRSALWKFVGKTPADFHDLDRRFVYLGLYLEGLLTESLEAYVCIDTSGSVSEDLLHQFLAELKGIISSYPHVKCELFFADTEIYGPFEIETIDELPKARGFGGTDFVPFFNYLKKKKDSFTDPYKVAIYLTDGYGGFPSKEPENPTMWLVPQDGLETAAFPFGEVIRISSK